MTDRVGIIGGGQLAWMMAQAAKRLGLALVIQTPHATDPAVAIATETILAPITDVAATARLAQHCQVITFENEFVDLDGLATLAARGTCFRPSLPILQKIIDKYQQRCYLQELGLPNPQVMPLDPSQTLSAADIDFPLVLKTRRHGYDGQGTFVLRNPQELDQVLKRVGKHPLLLEEFIPFERELAVIAARSVTGEMALYPIVETQQVNQVCRRVFAPAQIEPAVAEQAAAIAHQLLTAIEAVGVFGIELFQTIDGRVLINELAPRVHNSGHFTLDACVTSQFEQHLRAVAGLALGSPAMQTAGAVMVNLLGYESSHSAYQAKRQKLAALPNAHVYWYGKTESRPGRKLGHVTVLLDNSDRTLAEQAAHAVEAIWYPSAD